MEQQPQRYCRNCSEPLHGKYCAHCGQEDIDYKASLKNLIPEVLYEYFGFDSQVLKSIPLLLFKPGHLTNEFNEGHRERYIPPLRMYLIISLLFFFVQSATHHGGINMYSTKDGSTVSLDTDSTFQRAIDSVYQIDSVTKVKNGKDISENDPWYSKLYKEKSRKTMHNLSAYVSELKSRYPEMMFFLLPLCALILKLLYARRKRFYVEHLVFSFHIHSIAFVVLGVVYGLNYLFPGLILISSITSALIIAVYLFVAFLRVYKQSVVKTILKFMIFGCCYCCMFAVAYITMAFITILMF